MHTIEINEYKNFADNKRFIYVKRNGKLHGYEATQSSLNRLNKVLKFKLHRTVRLSICKSRYYTFK